jgi:hypothetical protein
MGEARCTNCGAPWRTSVVGSCGYCGSFGRPPEAGPAPRPGELDPQALCLALVACCNDLSRPLDGLTAVLVGALGSQRVSVEERDGRVAAMRTAVADRSFHARVMGDAVEVIDVHEVQGVVIRRQELDLGGLLAELALLLAPLAATDPRLHATLAALPA